MTDQTQFHLEMDSTENLPVAMLLLTLSSSCPETTPTPPPNQTPPAQQSFRFSFEPDHYLHNPEKADDLLSTEDDARTSGFSEVPLSETSANRKHQHRISKKCHGCGLFKKRVYRYLGATSSFCNACNQHWRRHSHNCPICVKLQQVGASEELRGIEVGGKSAVVSSVGSPGGISFLGSHRNKMSPSGPRALQRTHWQINPQGQSL